VRTARQVIKRTRPEHHATGMRVVDELHHEEICRKVP
jgi:hypothetical protein